MRLRIGVYVMSALALLAGCSSETPTDYSAANREAFLAACVDDSSDGLYQQRICLCVYEEAEATIPFARFLEIDDELSDPEAVGLPDDLLGVIADCVIEEGDL